MKEVISHTILMQHKGQEDLAFSNLEMININNIQITLNEEAGRALKSTSNHTATHCNTLQHTATHCNSALDLPQTSRANPIKWHSTHIKSPVATREKKIHAQREYTRKWTTCCNTLQHFTTLCCTLEDPATPCDTHEKRLL